MIPAELLTMFASGGLTAFARFMTFKAKMQSQQMETMINALKERAEVKKGMMKAASDSMDAAANRASDGLSSVFRGLIVVCLMAAFLFPCIAPALDIKVPVYITYYEEGRKIIGMFGELSDKLKFVRLEEGIVILPEFKHMMAAVIGFFFGSAATRR